MATTYSLAVRNADLDARALLLSGGYIRIYDGARPATVDTSIIAQQLIAELRFGVPAFGAAALGVITATAIGAGAGLVNPQGIATWARCFKSDGTSAVCDLDVGVGGSGADLILVNTTIPMGVVLTITALTISEP